MNILFIRPSPPEETIGLQHVMIVEPLELEILATLVKERNRVLIIDMILDKKPVDQYLKEFNPDVVCVTGYITHTRVMQDICSKVKNWKKEAITIIGGVHVEMLPESINHKDIDYRIIRNATRIFPQLIEYIEGGRDFPPGILRYGELKKKSSLPPFDFFVPHPDRKLTGRYRKNYFYVFHDKVALLKTSFGCPARCNFCYCRKLTDDIYHAREVEDVITELKSIPEKEIYIIDDDFLVSEKRLQSFMDLLEIHNIQKKYLIYGRADFIIKHPDLLKRFKKLGLRTIIVGLESFDNKELESLNKKITVNINEKTMSILNRLGIDCYASIIAMPEWGKEEFSEVTKKLISLKVKFLNIQPLTPLLGTDMEFNEEELAISRDEYEKWDLAHVTVKPEKLEVKEFYKEVLKMYEKVMLRPVNIIHHMKYPLWMQWRLMKGVRKVQKQYRIKFIKGK